MTLPDIFKFSIGTPVRLVHAMTHDQGLIYRIIVSEAGISYEVLWPGGGTSVYTEGFLTQVDPVEV